jgi:hypothetical protein
MTATNQNDLPTVAAILAAGLQRLLDRKSSQISRREAKSPLDCDPLSGRHIANKSEDIAL